VPDPLPPAFPAHKSYPNTTTLTASLCALAFGGRGVEAHAGVKLGLGDAAAEGKREGLFRSMRMARQGVPGAGEEECSVLKPKELLQIREEDRKKKEAKEGDLDGSAV
jgi:hypothetical protein